jgi:hypothetical protein
VRHGERAGRGIVDARHVTQAGTGKLARADLVVGGCIRRAHAPLRIHLLELRPQLERQGADEEGAHRLHAVDVELGLLRGDVCGIGRRERERQQCGIAAVVREEGGGDGTQRFRQLDRKRSSNDALDRGVRARAASAS